jgi:hypothetical protein
MRRSTSINGDTVFTFSLIRRLFELRLGEIIPWTFFVTNAALWHDETISKGGELRSMEQEVFPL